MSKMINNRSHKKKVATGEKIYQCISCILFGLFALICIYPFYYIFINSISANDLVYAGKIKILPQQIHFRNYLDVFRLNTIGSAAFVSVARTVLGTLTMLVSSSVLGYAMTRKEYWHRKFWYRYMVITMYFGAGMIPVYMTFRMLGLLNNFWVYVIPAAVSPYNMILIKTYIEGIPDSLEEAAIMDGAGYFYRFTRIVIPLCKPVLATVAVFTAVGQWNSYMDTILYMTKGGYQTLQSILYRYLTNTNALASTLRAMGDMTDKVGAAMNPAAIRHTVTAITILPVLFVYPFFQRYITKGIMIGAVKG